MSLRLDRVYLRQAVASGDSEKYGQDTGIRGIILTAVSLVGYATLSHLSRAIELSRIHMKAGEGGPFGNTAQLSIACCAASRKVA